MITYDLEENSLIIDVRKFNILLNGKFNILKIKIHRNKISELHTNNIVNDYFFTNNGIEPKFNDLTFIYAKDFKVLTTEDNSRFIYYNSNIEIFFNNGIIHDINGHAIEYGFKRHYIVNNKIAKDLKHFEILRDKYIRKNKILKCIK